MPQLATMMAIVEARCDLTGFVVARAIPRIDSQTMRRFVLQDLFGGEDEYGFQLTAHHFSFQILSFRCSFCQNRSGHASQRWRDHDAALIVDDVVAKGIDEPESVRLNVRRHELGWSTEMDAS
jgi:hypothetical protein